MLALLLLATLAADGGAGVPAAPEPLELARAAFVHRLDATSLDAAIARLDPLTSMEALVLDARAHRFRAEAFELRKRPLQRAAGVVDLETARRLAQKARGDASSPTLLQLPALAELCRADVALAGWRRPVEAAALLHEALDVATAGEALDASFDGGVFRVVRGAALAALPALGGGDLAAARFELERALLTAPANVEARVVLAGQIAVKGQDRRLFHALLISALRTPLDDTRDDFPEQLLARTRVLGLLHRERELFRG